MIPKECKRLAEVDFPIAEVSRHALREKLIRPGHPSTLHQWWARRPLGSSRAMLLALLLPDPCDSQCPDDFRTEARTTLLNMLGRPARWDNQLLTDAGLQQALLTFIADFANWDNADHPTFLTTSRELIRAAHPGETPLVVDPFAGGGSIPLEALRLGCDAYASDLNPVACLILKVLLEDIPRHGPQLADELRKAGTQLKAQADQELANLYPKDPDGAAPIAYLWARTVRCETPNCGAELPLIRSMWLCKKTKRKWALRAKVERPDNAPPKVEIEIFTPSSNREVSNGTVAGGKATCPCCRTVMPPARVRSQIASQRGGADTEFDTQGNRTGGALLTAVVTTKSGRPGRNYRKPTDTDYAAAWKAQTQVATLIKEWESNQQQGLCPIPDEPINPVRPSPSARGLSAVTRYGMYNFGDLFTARQKVALNQLVGLTAGLPPGIQQTIFGLLISKTADGNNSLARWLTDSESSVNLFSRQAIPFVWDFCESTPASTARGVFFASVDATCKVIDRLQITSPSLVQQADATELSLPSESTSVWFTDPPYYGEIPYADLSDFFLVWLKRALPNHDLLRDPFDSTNELSPKQQECVWNQSYEYDGRPKDAKFFEATITKAFQESRRILSEDGIGAVVFAHQSTDGWEAFLNGLIQSGWTATASWPIATEMASRIRARDSASLATSIHLVCRPRPIDAQVGDWSDVLRELPVRVSDWMERLQSEGIKGADLVFACVGPALEIFSRYSRVETAAGNEVRLPEYLEKVWEVVGRTALERVLGATEAQARNGTIGALEEDARLTALFLWTMQSSGEEYAESSDQSAAAADDAESGNNAGERQKKGYKMPFDVARRFAQPLGIHLEEWKSRIIDIDKGIVRLLPVSERNNQLLGKDENDPLLDEIETSAATMLQPSLFPDQAPLTRSRSQRVPAVQGMEPEPAGSQTGQRSLTTLDRVHMAMLYQSAGRSGALRALLQSEQERGTYFVRLANALSALYPSGSSEKRLLDAMLLAMPR